MIINTAELSVEAAAEIIVVAIRQKLSVRRRESC
jgi:hypothetical protein